MLVWRLEAANGDGVYLCGAAYWALGNTSMTEQHPGPSGDTKMAPLWNSLEYAQTGRYYFGFASIEQYKRWFYTAEGRAALDGRVDMVVYEVPDDCAILGNTQVAFLMEKATRIESFDPSHWDENDATPHKMSDGVYASFEEKMRTDLGGTWL